MNGASTILHERAMELADDAIALSRKGERDPAEVLFRAASLLETKAALLTASNAGRSILFRSAAALASAGGQHQKATKLAAQALDVEDAHGSR